MPAKRPRVSNLSNKNRFKGLPRRGSVTTPAVGFHVIHEFQFGFSITRKVPYTVFRNFLSETRAIRLKSFIPRTKNVNIMYIVYACTSTIYLVDACRLFFA